MKTKTRTFGRLPGVLLCLWLATVIAGAVDAVYPGVTQPYRDVILSAEVPGTVRSRFFEEGDFVRKGQVILELDKRLEELAVRKHKLAMDELKIELAADRKLLNTTKSVSQEEVDKKELDYQQATVDYEVAVEELNRRQIISPISGYIAAYFLHTGEDCKAQQPLVRVVDTRQCYFVSNVDADAGYDLKLGQILPLQIDAGPHRVSVKAKIVFLSPVVDPASGLMKVRLLFDNQKAKIRPGVTGKLILPKSKHGG